MTVIDFHGSLCSDLVFLMTLETFGLRTFKKHFGKHVRKCACFCHLQWQLDAFYLPSALPRHLFVCRTLSALQRGVVVLSLGESLSTLGGIFVWMRNTSHHYGFCSGALVLCSYSCTLPALGTFLNNVTCFTTVTINGETLWFTWGSAPSDSSEQRLWWEEVKDLKSTFILQSGSKEQ